MNASLHWVNKMKFEAHNRGHKTFIDASSDHGGEDAGPTPKELVLNAMMGCTAMDVLAMLNKMRQNIQNFDLEIQAEKNQEYPVHFVKAHILFKLKGEIEAEKANKAVTMSLSKYCGVNYMISKVCEITYEIILNEVKVGEGKALF